MSVGRIHVTGRGRQTRTVLVDRGNAPRTRRIAQRMWAAGMSAAWIAAALGVDRARVRDLIDADPMWGRALK